MPSQTKNKKQTLIYLPADLIKKLEDLRWDLRLTKSAMFEKMAKEFIDNQRIPSA